MAEVNTEETISVDIVKKWNEATGTVKGMNIEPLYNPEVCQKVTLCIDGNYGGEESKQVYEAIKSGHPSILFDLLTRYAETHDIKWGRIWGCEARHYEHGKTGKGHYIVSGYISGASGEEINFCSSCVNLLKQEAEARKDV